MQVANIDFEGEKIQLLTHGAKDTIFRRISRHSTFYEIDLLLAIRAAHQSGTYIYDIGANVGNHTIFFSRIMKQNVRSFEPFHESCEVLRENVKQNGVTDFVRVEEMGLGDYETLARADNIDRRNLGEVKMVPDSSGDIAIRTLDGLVADDVIGTIKIDVEGFELSVLKGARETLIRNNPELFIELSNDTSYDAASSFLSEIGYKVVNRYCATPTYHFRNLL